MVAAMDTVTAPLRHALSVDVEDWYHDGGTKPADGALADRVVANTERLLDLFAAAGARGTFFFLGDVAERYPALPRRVAGAGHEIASHGDKHGHLSALSRKAFRDDVARSLAILQDAVGVRIRGYRAPISRSRPASAGRSRSSASWASTMIRVSSP